MDEMTFYDRNGRPICYTQDGEHIYLFSGEPVAYLYDGSVYAFSGKHLGWYIDGWIRDHNGNCVFFTEHASGGPIKPVRQVRPVKSVKQIRPIKGVKEIKPVRPVRTLSWSPLSSEAFFEQ